MQFKRTKCNCKECPLDGRKKVHSEYGIDKPKIAFIAEAPGAVEDELGKPLVGPSGSLIQQAAAKAGIVWHTTYRMNTICCRPTDNEIGSSEGQQALECCRPGLEEELEFAKKLGIKVYGVLGATAMKSLGIQGSLLKQRGSVNMFGGDRVAIPTFHPSYIMRGNWGEEVTWVNDLMKIRDLSLKAWKPPREKFNLFPTVQDVKDFLKKALATDALVACDIETTSLSPFYSKILMIGLALDGEEAIVVPFTKQGGIPYWNDKDRREVDKCLREILGKCRTMFQNAAFDTWHLKRHGYPVGRLEHDTMLAHHAIHPELPHNLGYIVSIYGSTPYWKDVVLGSEDKMIQMQDAEVRTYNARDTVVLHQIMPKLLKDLKEMGTEKTYREWSMRLVGPLREMSDTGMLIDRVKMKGKATKFKREADKAEKGMRELLQLPEAFNFGSGDHMRLLVHGVRPKGEKKTLEELAEYEKNPKKRKDTKKYRELVEKQELYKNVKPLYQSKARIRTTDGGSLATDDEALLQIKRAALARLDAIEYLVRKTEAHEVEKKEIEKLLKFYELYMKYAEVEKLASTFTGFPIMSDGRVHPSFKIHGTATGRLSSSDPNGQNIPGEVQDVFIASPGNVLLKADYSNIEYRVMAIMTGERWLEEEFEKGVNFHDINTKLLFGIEKGHPQWDVCRRAAKTFIFGLSYGGTPEGIYKKILIQVPEMRLTLPEFRKLVDNYFKKMPNYAKWCEAIKKQARDTRVVETAFGRKRILLGLPDEIERQALNTPIQGTAGEVCELAIIELSEAFEKKKELGAKMILTVHDSILVECFEKKKMEVARIMKKVMEKPRKIGSRMCSFPVDIGAGASWAETDDKKNKITEF